MAQKHEFYHSSVYKLVLSFVNGIFLYVFLLVFLPFGVSNYDPNHEYTLDFLLEIGHFVPLVIFLTLFNEFAIKPIFKGRSSLKFIIGWTIWSFILLGSAVFLLYNFLGNWHDWRWSSFPGFVIDVSAVLLFPIAGTFFFFRYKKLQEEYDEVLTKAEGGSDLKEMIHFSGEGVKDNISISVQDFLFARAQDNYTELYYLKDRTASKFLIRSSLSSLMKTLEYDFILRCHRSFLINLYNVHSIKGSRKNLKISMRHSDMVLPVSKTYVDDILNGLKLYMKFQ